MQNNCIMFETQTQIISSIILISILTKLIVIMIFAIILMPQAYPSTPTENSTLSLSTYKKAQIKVPIELLSRQACNLSKWP